MHRGFCGLVLIAVCAFVVESYHFKDDYFNDIMLHEIVQISGASDGLSLTRKRREAEDSSDPNDEPDEAQSDGDKKCQWRGSKNKDKFRTCCNIKPTPEQLAQFEQGMTLLNQCFQEIRGNNDSKSLESLSCEEMKKAKKDFVCVVECSSKKLGLADEAGNQIDDNVKEYVKKSIPEAQKQLADEITTKCLQEAKQAPEPNTSGDSTSEQKKCNPSSVKMKSCVWREILKTCPKELQNNSPKCASMLARMEKGHPRN